ncbi:hypothetical protein [Oceanobacillus oncorhynchi]|uniref:hypothetical protein n=1 Tax=Oceanobacillus oncorhynchi TaxID=545501 RepID=UPI00186686E2|nr:hypothetical protein [Oceanobacillus oncorhynchi]
MKQLARLFMSVALVLLLIGCGDSKEDVEPGTNSGSEDAAEDLEATFAEADENALEFYRAFYEFNLPEFHELLAPNQQQELLENERIDNLSFLNWEGGTRKFDEPIEELIDDQKFPEIKAKYQGTSLDKESAPNSATSFDYDEEVFRDFNTNQEYQMIRLKDAFTETGEIFYYINNWDYEGNYAFLATKRNEDGDWKFRIASDSEVGINPSRKEEKEELENIGDILHPTEGKEDDYGF